MEAFVLDICGREKGLLLQNKTFVSLDGPIYSISNTYRSKPISFAHAAWNKLDTEIIAGDCLGHVSFLTFTNDKTHNILVALSDCSIVSLNLNSREVKNHFYHHTSCVTHISFDKSCSTILSCCKDQAILWDLNSFNIVRILTLKKNVDILKVFFLLNKNIIVSAFNDNSVFLWNCNTFKCTDQFLCASGETYLNIKVIDASKDEKLLACAGKANWLIIWSVVEHKKLHTVSLPESVTCVKQVYFLPNSDNNHILSLLSSDGEIHIFNVTQMELLYKLSRQNGKIISFCNPTNMFQVLAITSQGNMELYDVEEFVDNKSLELKKKKQIKKVKSVKEVKVLLEKKAKKKQQISVNIGKVRLQTVIKNFEEYPEKHRFFVWSQLLDLPHNVDAFKVLHQESLKVKSFVKDYSFMNPGVQKTFLRLMAMLVTWNPLIQEIEYFQCVVFPFIKILHTNTIICFELLVTIISNWCQNWFIFSPSPPFNILCAIESILSFHDRELIIHFIKHDISPEIYGWSLLKSSFSEVFNKKEWLKLWDNIFSNPLSFQLYAVVAFNIAIRDVLLCCQTLKQFKECYRKHGISASVLLKKAYELQEISPSDFDPQVVTGTFAPIPKGTYPSFFQMSQMKVDLKTLIRKTIIDQEIDYLKQREDQLDIKSNYLKELQDLQILRRKLLLESIGLKDIEALEKFNRKVRFMQNLIQDNLENQINMLKVSVGGDMFSRDLLDTEKQDFQFKQYVNKIRKES
ncbi:TBC1 domain family member 31 [Caerostris extrusa]|uniref:TBC1 domain family member 31 n=1 Tax=Caerostris extrusa TaxID=172846 RepID=A0AAV4WLI5_CAEEX|nr:TBC1 domain family member 31 [Caerostris extrusa]